MITRAQAEALLTLAEALEDCERQGVHVRPGLDGQAQIDYGPAYPDTIELSEYTGMLLRLAVNDLVPKNGS